ncbi:hypothetical protein P8605_31275, partial [Streptomyces sp. T-3]|nr:hypothetical protein [Streptomyces sp. T-3]
RAGKARSKAEPEVPEGPSPTAAAPPHLAGADELGASGSEPDWWRVDSSPFGAADSVPGFVGGVEIPEILRPPQEKPHEHDHEHGEFEEEEGEEGEFEEGTEAPVRRSRFPRLRRGGLDGEAPGHARVANPLLLLAALALLAGAALGNWLALGIGWILAYTSRRLGPAERKFAALGLPGLVAAGGVVWLWGRVEGRWGEAVPEEGMRDALEQTWPWVVRVAAVASALFLVWRSQRQRPE